MPGRSSANRSLRFAGRWISDRHHEVRHAVHARHDAGRPMRVPVAHGEGCYYADDATLDRAGA